MKVFEFIKNVFNKSRENEKMSWEEIKDMHGFANRLFDFLELEKRNPSIRIAFVMGFLYGRDFTLEQLGCFDNDDDDDADIGEPPEIIKLYLEYDKEKSSSK